MPIYEFLDEIDVYPPRPRIARYRLRCLDRCRARPWIVTITDVEGREWEGQADTPEVAETAAYRSLFLGQALPPVLQLKSMRLTGSSSLFRVRSLFNMISEE